MKIEIDIDVNVTEQILQPMITLSKDIIKQDLIGLYLHGSLAMGCYNPKQSDIDLLIVVTNKLTLLEQKSITQGILSLYTSLSDSMNMAMTKIELSIVREDVVRHFIFPTPFEYHFSNFHFEKYVSDENYVCGGFEDPDLAAHFTVIYERGVTLYGAPIREIFKPIDRKYYVQALLNDIEDASTHIIEQPVYYVLNLCRVLFYLQEGIVSSKKEGGEWGLRQLPEQFHSIIANALDEYTGEFTSNNCNNNFHPESLLAFSQYMTQEIMKANNN